MLARQINQTNKIRREKRILVVSPLSSEGGDAASAP
jgi:hypothetical protein